MPFENSPGLGVPVSLIRAGTSKGVFVDAQHVPTAPAERDAFLLRLMGSPDPMQLDGLGGTHSSTSKVMIVTPSQDPACDVEYTFAQIGVDKRTVDVAGNCGNLTPGVALFAASRGWCDLVEPVTEVRLRNVNTGRSVEVAVPVEAEAPRTTGDVRNDGVPGTGPGFLIRFLDPAGAVTGRVLPTRHLVDQVRVSPDLPALQVTLVDVSGPTMFARLGDVIAEPHPVSPEVINGDPRLLILLEQIRGAGATLLGLADDAESAAAQSPALPRLALIRNPDPAPGNGRPDISVVTISGQRAHHACPLTVAQATAVAALLRGSIPGDLSSPRLRTAAVEVDDIVQIAHPKGIVDITVHLDRRDGPEPRVRSVSYERTARVLLDGVAYVPWPS